MANVYVGFRYVPLFCGVWDNSKGYEALSVVTHNGGGYTSNKPVPAGIEPGTDNGEYWAYTYRAGGEASAIDWDNVQNKPSTYPTTWEKVDGKPNVFPTNWENIEDIPANFPTTWENVSEKPTSFPTTWGSVEGKPQTFPPSKHIHEISQIDGLTAELETIGDSLTSINNTLNSYDGEFFALEKELTSINNTVSTISTNLSTLENTVTEKANTDLSNVSNEDFSAKAAAAGVGGGGGASTWDEITGKPDIFPTNWDNIAGKPTSYPSTWGEVTGKPENYPTNWASISDKPTTFTPSTHSHSISDINGLSTELEELTNDISGLTGTLQTVTNNINSINTNITSITNTLDDKMNSPTNNGSSTSYFLRWSNANQGTWATLPTASATQAGTMSSVHYKQVQNTKRYVSNEGTYGIFNFRYWSDGFVELWAKVEVSNLSVSKTLGKMYRSDSPFTDAQYKYPYTFYPQPFVYTQFFTSNNASAFVWLNPTWSRATQYLQPLYLVRPTTGTCSGYVYYYICGDTQ